MRLTINRYACSMMVLGFLGISSATTLGEVGAPVPPPPDATITSDALEMIDNGAKTFFKGHVVLKQEPYRLLADRMVQTKATQVVQAFGHIRGTWTAATGEKMLAVGDHATYSPAQQLTDLWGHAKVTRWENAVDTNPVVALADHFTASELDHTVLAHQRVWISQGKGLSIQADEARYVQADQIIYFSGEKPVAVHYEGVKQNADFVSRKAQMSLSPKKARLIENVQGHVVPL